jgi:hypothetical protein
MRTEANFDDVRETMKREIGGALRDKDFGRLAGFLADLDKRVAKLEELTICPVDWIELGRVVVWNSPEGPVKVSIVGLPWRKPWGKVKNEWTVSVVRLGLPEGDAWAIPTNASVFDLVKP